MVLSRSNRILTFLWMSLPVMMIWPAEGLRSLISIRKVVVLPAPLAPMTVNMERTVDRISKSYQEDQSNSVLEHENLDDRQPYRDRCASLPLASFGNLWSDRGQRLPMMLRRDFLVRPFDVRGEHQHPNARASETSQICLWSLDTLPCHSIQLVMRVPSPYLDWLVRFVRRIPNHYHIRNIDDITVGFLFYFQWSTTSTTRMMSGQERSPLERLHLALEWMSKIHRKNNSSRESNSRRTYNHYWIVNADWIENVWNWPMERVRRQSSEWYL